MYLYYTACTPISFLGVKSVIWKKCFREFLRLSKDYLATLHCIGVRCWPTQFCSKIFERPACRWAKHRRYPTSHSQVWSPSSNITQLLYFASKKVLHNLIRLLGVDLDYPRSKGDAKGHHSFKLNIGFQQLVNCKYQLFTITVAIVLVYP